MPRISTRPGSHPFRFRRIGDWPEASKRDGNVGVQGSQRFVVEGLRERVQPIEAVCPPTNDDDPLEPRIEGFDQTREILDIGFAGPYRFSSKIGAKTRRRISSHRAPAP